MVDVGRSVYAPQKPASRSIDRIVQRVPMPPSYKGAIGVFDRSRVIISDIEDMFVQGATTTPVIPLRRVTVAFREPSVAHLSWLLYDPNDTLITGFSTSRSDP